jgi:hypothetical protein
MFVVAVPSIAALEIDADLTVGRLDDPRLLGYLRIELTAVVGQAARAP